MIMRKLLLFIVLFSGVQWSHSQNNWDGDNTFGNFSFCNNWFVDACPATFNSTTDLNIQLKNNNTQVTMYLDYGMWKDVNNITYFATYSPAVLLNQFDADGPVGNENGINFYGKMENYSPNNSQVFNLPFHGRNATVIQINPINSGFTFNRPIYNSGNRNFYVYGDNGKKITLNSYPEGNASVGFYIKENSIVEVNYTNPASLSGGYFVEEGELWVNSNGVIQGGIQVGNSNTNITKLYISNLSTPTTIANAIVVPAGSTNASIGSLNTTNTHTYSGTINLNNNTVNFDVVSAGGTANFTGVISGSGAVQKINPGLVRFSAANTYTGNTIINTGTLQYGVANAISNSSNVILNGGKYSTGATVGYSDTVGTLALTEDSTIELGTGTHSLNFANSSAVAWTATKILTITGWTNSCSGAKVFVGINNTGLTAGQLAQVQFSGYPLGAKISPVGELIPNNVMLTATAGTLTGSYATLTAAFAAINAATHTGNITISILNDINEGANTAVLNQVAGVTSVLVQPGGCGPRIVTGTGTSSAGNPLIDLNGADNVTINGLNTGGNSLTISNTSTSNAASTCTIRFQNDATLNSVTNCTVLGSSTTTIGTAGGNIWFGAATPVTGTGNDNNTVSDCNIGPAGTNLPSKAICFTGSGGTGQNNAITINNNNIYDYFNQSIESAGIYVTTGTTAISITNNRFYQTSTRTQTTGFTHSAIKIANAAGVGYDVSGNTIGYSSSAGTGNYAFVGILNSVFNPINISVGSATPSSVQNNTIAGITHSTSSGTFATIFNGINITAGSTVNVGNIAKNTIGLPAAPLTFTATAGLGGTVNGINMSGIGTMAVQNNVVQSITTGGIAGTAINLTGISVAGAALYNVTSNTIGHPVAANSISLGVLGTSTTLVTFIGILSNATGNVTIGDVGIGNTIQNVTFNATGNNSCTGISTTGANAITNIGSNVIKGFRFAAGAGSAVTGIINSGAVTTNINITNNNVGITGSNFATYDIGSSGAVRGIINSAGVAAALAITGNDITGITHSLAATSTHLYISNSAASTTLININSNTFTNLNVNTVGSVIFIATSSSLTASGVENVNSNNISGSYTRAGTTGNVYLFSNSASATGATINNTNNNFSNITVAGTTQINGWVNTGGNASNMPTKIITGNTFTNWSGSSFITVINTNFSGGTSSISNNTITNITSSNILTAINVGSGGSGTLDINSNTINTLTSNGTTGSFAVNSLFPGTTSNTNLNTISNLSCSSTGIVGAIGQQGANTTKSISNNTISNLNSTSGSAWGIYCDNGTTVSVNNNTLSNFSAGGANAYIKGIYGVFGTTSTITGNTINVLSCTSTGVSASLRAIEMSGGTASIDISNNTVTNISSSTTNATTGAIAGIYYASSGAASTISGNTIGLLDATTTSAIDVVAAAIVTTNTSGSGTISKNRIYGLTNTATGTNTLTAGFVPNGGGWTFANNMISITNNNATRAVGVYDTGALGARKYFYNSIYIGGTHAGTQISYGLLYTATTGSVELKNNILMMNRTSGAKNYAIGATSGFTNYVSDYNVFNCSNTATIGNNGGDLDFTALKSASSNDTNSYTALPITFANVAIADLHITGGCSEAESGGTPITVTDDYDGTARNATTPDIGADEFSGTAPANVVISPASPSVCIGSGVSITASSTDLTYTYTWSPATGLSATTGATVTASPTVTTTYTVTATNLSGCTKIKYITVAANILPAAITVSPSSVNICANTIQTFTASPYTGTATVGVASGTSVAGNSPYRQGTSTEVRIQYLITKAELNAAGMAGGNITSLSFNVVAPLGNGNMPSYVITMANTTATALTSNYLTLSSPTTVYSNSYLPTLGTNTHTFTTPFAWNGTSNIVINICHTGIGGLASIVSVSTPSVISTNSNTGTGSCSLGTSSPAGANANRPVMTFGFENPITWSPVTDLYIDATATTAYNPATHLNQPTIYSKPSAPRVYTATLTTVGTGCTQTSTGTITMSNSVWNGSGWLPSTPTGNTSLEFTGNFTSSANLSGCSCTVTSGTVVFNDPATLTLTNGLTVSGGSITFNNNASLLQINDAATNSGNINMQRTTQPMYRFDYTYWGSPVTFASNYTLGVFPDGLSPETLPDKYYSWTPTIANGPGTWAQESAATVMNPIKGYIVRAPSTFSFNPLIKTPYTATFKGVPNNGVISCPIYHGSLVSPDDRDKWNLLGNPYPSAVDAQAFLTHAANTPIIDGTIYFWTHHSAISTSYLDPFYGDYVLNYNDSDYATWNSMGAVGSRGSAAPSTGGGGMVPNGFIAAGQAFFTKSDGTAPSGNAVIFNNSMRVAGSNDQFFRSSTAIPNASTTHTQSTNSFEKHRIWINMLTTSGIFNQILVGYAEGATLGWDRGLDGIKFADDSGTALYSTLDDKKLVIQGRPLPFNDTDEVALGFRSAQQDTFSIRIDHFDDLFENQNVYLEDKLLNVIHNLKQSPYTFTAGAGTFNDRFVLRYTDTTLGTPDFDAVENVAATINNHQLFIESSKSIAKIDLHDVSGKLIKTYAPKDKNQKFTTDFYFENGVYFAKIRLDNGIEVTRKLIH